MYQIILAICLAAGFFYGAFSRSGSGSLDPGRTARPADAPGILTSGGPGDPARSARSADAFGAKPGAAEGTAEVAPSSQRERLREKLRALSSIDAKPMRSVADCYAPLRMDEEREETVECLACDKVVNVRGTTRELMELLMFRQHVEHISNYGIEARMDGTSFCSKCNPSLKERPLYLDIRHDGKRLARNRVIERDLELLIEFFCGHDIFRESSTRFSDMLDHVEKIETLLGLEAFRKLAAAGGAAAKPRATAAPAVGNNQIIKSLGGAAARIDVIKSSPRTSPLLLQNVEGDREGEYMSQLPDTFEVKCSKCKKLLCEKKKSYHYNEFPGRVALKAFIINSLGFDASINNSTFCPECNVAGSTREIILEVRTESGANPVKNSVSMFDLDLVISFLKGNRLIYVSREDIVPLKKYIPRIEALLGIHENEK